MPVEDAVNPLYADRENEWQICDDALRGQQAVKDAGQRYLPMPTGFAASPDTKVRDSLYTNYLERAEFPDIYSLTLRGMVGLVHRQESEVKGIIGTPLEPLFEQATRPGSVPALTLAALHQQITEALVHKGRAGLLADARSSAQGGSYTPFLSLYTADSIRNWSPDGRMYVLDESGVIQDPGDEFNWVYNHKYRVLRLSDGVYTGQVYATYDSTSSSDPQGYAETGSVVTGASTPAAARVQPAEARMPGGRVASASDGTTRSGPTRSAAVKPRDTLVSGADPYTPRGVGGRALREIPIVVGGPIRMGLEPDNPPLLGVARCAVAIYRLDADYRHQLYMSGQETLVLTGVKKEDLPAAVGAGIVIGLPQSCTAEYVAPTCSGINAHKTAIADEFARAVTSGVQLLDQGGSQQSGDALKIRYGAQHATLVTIARQSAAILEGGLRHAGLIAGMSREQIEAIIVVPNLEFVDVVLSAQDANQLVQVWMSGAISYETLYENFTRGNVTSGERTAQQEQDLIKNEAPDRPTAGTTLGGSTAEATPELGTGATPLGTAANDVVPSDDAGTEAGPDSISDAELRQTFGSYADDVARAG